MVLHSCFTSYLRHCIHISNDHTKKLFYIHCAGQRSGAIIYLRATDCGSEQANPSVSMAFLLCVNFLLFYT